MKQVDRQKTQEDDGHLVKNGSQGSTCAASLDTLDSLVGHRSCKTCAFYEEVLAGRGDHWVKRCEAGCEPINARWCKAYVPNK